MRRSYGELQRRKQTETVAFVCACLSLRHVETRKKEKIQMTSSNNEQNKCIYFFVFFIPLFLLLPSCLSVLNLLHNNVSGFLWQTVKLLSVLRFALHLHIIQNLIFYFHVDHGKATARNIYIYRDTYIHT